MRLHYIQTNEPVNPGDQIITPDNMYIKIIAIYEHSGAILIEVLSDDCVLRRRGATADEIGADWCGVAPPGFGNKSLFGKLLTMLNEPFEATGDLSYKLSRHDCERLLLGLSVLRQRTSDNDEAEALQELAERLRKV